MPFDGTGSFVKELEKQGELIRIREFVNPELEITEIADRVSKQSDGGKALLFENTGTRFPLLINALGSEKRISMAFGVLSLVEIEKQIESLFAGLMDPKDTLWDKLKMLPMLKSVAGWMPKKIKGRGKCQEIMMETPDLSKLPVLKCWPADGGRFITLPGVHTVDPETKIPNLGMYRMQVVENNLTGMHWHRHKTGAAHFGRYKKAGIKMPVSVTLGGDPVYTYCASAPMPENVDEYLLAGFLRKKQVRMVKCITNDLYVPEDVDFVIEGYVNPDEDFFMEGPFGDHTGFYSLADLYPYFHVTCITHRSDAIYPATIVGIPPMEDAYIGKATERIFLTPIRMAMVPELADMELPFAGVAHNLTLVKIHKTYPGQAVKVMHSLWGAGQMMFNKILAVVDHDVDLHDSEALIRVFNRNFNPGYSLHYSKGPLDVLDHSSHKFAFGSKLGIDLTNPFPGEEAESTCIPVGTGFNVSQLTSFNEIRNSISLLESGNLPVLLLEIEKSENFVKTEFISRLSNIKGISEFKMILFFSAGANLTDLFMLVWLLGGNIEPVRDITITKTMAGDEIVVADCTIKSEVNDNFKRDWPNVVVMDRKTIHDIDQKWENLGLGDFLLSPSLKYFALNKGDGAVRG